MLAIQLIVYCLIFTLMVRLSVMGGAVNGVFFYPKAVQERAIELGLSDRTTIDRKFKRFMTLFYLVMAAALLLIIGVWNKASDFKTAYRQALFFLEGMNIYDGIVIDKLWVGHSTFWLIPGLEDMQFVQTWGQVLHKRIKLALVWVAGAALAAGLVVLLF